jgi:hypothetical protein
VRARLSHGLSRVLPEYRQGRGNDKKPGEEVVVSESAVGVLADAAVKTGLSRDCFEVRQIPREEYERLKEP